MMDYVENECRRGLYCNGVKRLTLKNVTMSGQDGEMLTAENVDEVVLL
jgi:hypothetical protein